MGTEDIEKELNALGYETILPTTDFVSFRFKIPHGKFRGQEVNIALHAPNYPDIPPAGPHIKPFLLPFKDGTDFPYDGIHQRNLPTDEYQYWSRPFKDWDKTEKNMRVYLAFLRTIFDFE